MSHMEDVRTTMQHADSLPRRFGRPTQSVKVSYEGEPLDKDLARLKESARLGGVGVNLAAMGDDEMIYALLQR